MSDTPATRAPQPPEAPHSPAPAPGTGPHRATAPESRTEPRRPIDWERIVRNLVDAVKRARRHDPEEYETHA